MRVPLRLLGAPRSSARATFEASGEVPAASWNLAAFHPVVVTRWNGGGLVKVAKARPYVENARLRFEVSFNRDEQRAADVAKRIAACVASVRGVVRGYRGDVPSAIDLLDFELELNAEIR